MKTATTVEHQIMLLKSRGLSIPDEKKAYEVLSDIGYYRLGFYWSPFETQSVTNPNREHKFHADTTFTDALQLYYFDLDLRECLARYLHRIELSFRTAVIHQASNKYHNDPTWFSNKQYMTKEFLEDSPLSKSKYSKIKRNPSIRRHHIKYHNDIYAPAWKTLEFLTLGDIQHIFGGLKDTALKLRITIGVTHNNYYVTLADQLDMNKADKYHRDIADKHITAFYNYIEALRLLRNQCAHHHPLFDFRLRKPLHSIKKRMPLTNDENNNIRGCIKLIHYLIKHISNNRACEMATRLKVIADTVNSPITKQLLSPIIQTIQSL